MDDEQPRCTGVTAQCWNAGTHEASWKERGESGRRRGKLCRGCLDRLRASVAVHDIAVSVTDGADPPPAVTAALETAPEAAPS